MGTQTLASALPLELRPGEWVLWESPSPPSVSTQCGPVGRSMHQIAPPVPLRENGRSHVIRSAPAGQEWLANRLERCQANTGVNGGLTSKGFRRPRHEQAIMNC